MLSGGGPAGGPVRSMVAQVREGLRGDRVLTVPNALTALRLACLPVFGALLARPGDKGKLAAGCLLGALGVTDGLDGYIARHYDQESTLGKVADPIADRALLLSAAAGALATGSVPPWLAGAALAREVLVVTGGALVAVSGGGRLDVSRTGKAGTFGMMVAFPLFIIGRSGFRWAPQARTLAWVAAGAGQVLAWAALAGYLPRALAATTRVPGAQRLDR